MTQQEFAKKIAEIQTSIENTIKEIKEEYEATLKEEQLNNELKKTQNAIELNKTDIDAEVPLFSANNIKEAKINIIANEFSFPLQGQLVAVSFRSDRLSPESGKIEDLALHIKLKH